MFRQHSEEKPGCWVRTRMRGDCTTVRYLPYVNSLKNGTHFAKKQKSTPIPNPTPIALDLTTSRNSTTLPELKNAKNKIPTGKKREQKQRTTQNPTPGNNESSQRRERWGGRRRRANRSDTSAEQPRTSRRTTFSRPLTPLQCSDRVPRASGDKLDALEGNIGDGGGESMGRKKKKSRDAGTPARGRVWRAVRGMRMVLERGRTFISVRFYAN
ncbi:hypothetical protein NL676_014518 [Syzygium grande]|nr:hypothetical protein NL676_014518 [Syzygium grande]